jgi:hypothetical protein
VLRRLRLALPGDELRLKGSRIAPAAEEARPAARRAPKNTVLRARGRRKTGLLRLAC